MAPILRKPAGVARVHTDVSPKRIRVVIAFSAALLTLASDAGAGQTRVDQASANPAPSIPAVDATRPNVVTAAPAGPAIPAWKDKQIPDWTDADAKQLLADSPWAKSVTPTSDKPLEKKPTQSGARKRFGIGGFGIGRRGASSDPASSDSTSSSSSSTSSSSSSQGSGATSSSSNQASADQPLPTLRLRWESALPVREAELKSRDTGALAVDENHYAIAVYGIPTKTVKDDSKKFAEQLKAQAAIKRDGKEDIKPSSVEIRVREDGPVILYLFPRTEEITWRDHEIEFSAQVGPLKFKQSFQSDDMRFHGTLEL
jgi:hypothetical protein